MILPNVRVPTETEKQIIQENGMDPSNYGVCYRDETCIKILCYVTRDIITIDKGDRKW